MIIQKLPERIENREILENQLDCLVSIDKRLEPIRKIAGEVPLRRREGGFEGMAKIVTSQLLSVASANAIYGRFEEKLGEVSAPKFIDVKEDEIRACGISAAKYRTMRTVAEAELGGNLSYSKLPTLPVKDAMAELTNLKGIGPWTAEIYLLFCVGHPDIFPAGDLVLQKMVAVALDLSEKPDEKQTRKLTKNWSPYRGASARLLWSYFAATKNRAGI